jgi:hypothetical protein
LVAVISEEGKEYRLLWAGRLIRYTPYLLLLSIAVFIGLIVFFSRMPEKNPEDAQLKYILYLMMGGMIVADLLLYAWIRGLVDRVAQAVRLRNNNLEVTTIGGSVEQIPYKMVHRIVGGAFKTAMKGIKVEYGQPVQRFYVPCQMTSDYDELTRRLMEFCPQAEVIFGLYLKKPQ